MRNDDLRTLAYKAFDLLAGASFRIGFVPDELLEDAKAAGLLDFAVVQNDADQRAFRVFPLASKPPTQVAAVAGIDSHKGMGTK